MKILTFNRHEPYIELMAAAGHEWAVAPPPEQPDLWWRTSFRPVPGNVLQVPTSMAMDGLRLGNFDLCLSMTLPDLRKCRLAAPGARHMFVELNMLSESFGCVGNPTRRVEALAGMALTGLLDGVELVFISEKKRADWGPLGEGKPVVVSGVDTDYWQGYTGTDPCVLRVGNMLKQRDRMQGYSVSERILEGLPSVTLGIQGGAIDSKEPASVGELREYYRTFRVMLSCLDDEREDGYNLAVLEAMSCGMPVVCMPNSSAPVGAYPVEDEAAARGSLELFLGSQLAATQVGATGRECVTGYFNLDRCASEWAAQFEGAT